MRTSSLDISYPARNTDTPERRVALGFASPSAKSRVQLGAPLLDDLQGQSLVFAQKQRWRERQRHRREVRADFRQSGTRSRGSLQDYQGAGGGLMISPFTGEKSVRVPVFPFSVTTSFWKTHLMPSPSCNAPEFWR